MKESSRHPVNCSAHGRGRPRRSTSQDRRGSQLTSWGACQQPGGPFSLYPRHENDPCPAGVTVCRAGRRSRLPRPLPMWPSVRVRPVNSAPRTWKDTLGSAAGRCSGRDAGAPLRPASTLGWPPAPPSAPRHESSGAPCTNRRPLAPQPPGGQTEQRHNDHSRHDPPRHVAAFASHRQHPLTSGTRALVGQQSASAVGTLCHRDVSLAAPRPCPVRWAGLPAQRSKTTPTSGPRSVTS